MLSDFLYVKHHVRSMLHFMGGLHYSKADKDMSQKHLVDRNVTFLTNM